MSVNPTAYTMKVVFRLTPVVSGRTEITPFVGGKFTLMSRVHEPGRAYFVEKATNLSVIFSVDVKFTN